MMSLRRIAADKLFPQRSIRVETGETVRYVHITPRVQAVVALCGMAAFLYVLSLSAIVGIEYSIRNSIEAKDEVVHATYQERIGELASNSEQLMASASANNERKRQVVQQLGAEKGAHLQALARQTELERNVAVLEERLAGLTLERNGLQSEVERLTAQVDQLSSRVDEQLSAEQFQDAVERTLDIALKQLDTRAATIADLQQQVEGLQHDFKLQEGHYDFIFRNIEGAVELALVPMNKALERSGVEVDSLLDTVRRRFSNAGGGGGPLSSIEQTLSDGPHANRIRILVERLDRVHFTGLALQKIPISMPVSGRYRYSSNFGLRKDPFTKQIRQHQGVDMVARSGAPIYATADGKVVFAGWNSGFGRMIRVRHIHGFETVYGHLKKIHVRVGQMVSRGERIGDMGNSGRSTGTHLHYEVRVNGTPKDPKKYLEAGRNVF